MYPLQQGIFNHHNVLRSITDVTRTIVIWGVGLIVTFSVKDSDWENDKWSAILIELAGFSLLVLGNFIFSRIIVLPFLEKDS